MNNFTFVSPTKIVFGKGSMKQIHDYVPELGKRVLLVYGGGSIKKNGIYDTVLKELKDCQIYELSGVEPNPRLTSVQKGVDLCHQHDIEVIVAIGGGSVIDCSKVIAASVFYPGDAWDVVRAKTKIEKALPLVCILTMSATGSEMNDTAVITNWEKHQKIGVKSEKLFPTISFLDPENLYTVPAYQSACGIADILSHLWEQFFTNVTDAYVQDGLALGCMKACIEYGPITLSDPTNYTARANIMWAATMALNGLLKTGYSPIWSCHPMEHELSAFYDVTHGAGLAILTPRWMRYVLNDSTVDRFVLYGTSLFGISKDLDSYAIANEAIDRTETFLFDTMQLPRTLKEIGIDESKLEIMAKQCVELKGGFLNGFQPLTYEDVLKIYKMCL